MQPGRSRFYTSKASADPSIDKIVVAVNDADIAIGLLYHAERYSKPILVNWGKSSTGRNYENLDMRLTLECEKMTLKKTTVEECVGPEIASALLGMYVFTGNGKVSSFVRHGKVSAYRQLMKRDNWDMRSAFAELGNSEIVSENLMLDLEIATLKLYNCEKYKSLQEARAGMIKSSFKIDSQNVKGIDEALILPTRSVLRPHIKRANYEVLVMKNACKGDFGIPNPHGHGWNVAIDKISIEWVEGEIFPSPLVKKNESISVNTVIDDDTVDPQIMPIEDQVSEFTQEAEMDTDILNIQSEMGFTGEYNVDTDSSVDPLEEFLKSNLVENFEKEFTFDQF